MYLLLHLATRRDGVDKLLENQIIEYISELSFIDQRPEDNFASMGKNCDSRSLQIFYY